MEAQDLERDIASWLDRGDWAAAVALAFRAWGPDLLGYVAAILRDRDFADAQEVAGELYLRLLERAHQFERRSTFRGWMYRIARNLALSFLETPGVRRVRRLDTHEVEALEAVRETTAMWRRSACKDALSRIREHLDSDEQTLLILLVDRQLTSEEVADVLSEGDEVMTAAAVRQRYKRLRHKLRKLFEAEGILGG
jgi:RNA polymerase sigma-70 factor (ECF subfamily)